MFDRELRRFRASIRDGAYEVSEHAFLEMEADGLTVLDLEECVLTGVVVERQLDRRTAERKFLVEGRACDGSVLTVVTKRTETGRMLFLTAFRC